MPCIKIKQLDERVATMGLHMGGNSRLRRKLEPGEIVFIPEDELIEVDGENMPLIDLLWSTGKLDLSRGKPTRPLDYETEAEAKLCSPSFRAHEPNDLALAEKARARVAKRLEEDQAKFDDDDRGTYSEKKSADVVQKTQGGNRRALRRKQLEEAASGEEATA